MKKETDNFWKELLEIIMTVAGDNLNEKYKRIKELLEIEKIKLDDAIPMLKTNGISIDEFLEYLYKNTMDHDLIFSMKLRVETKIKDVQKEIDSTNKKVQELKERIKELDLKIYEKNKELTNMRDDLGPNDIITDEHKRLLYIGDAWQIDYINGGYKPKYDPYDNAFVPLSRSNLSTFNSEKIELSSEDQNFYTEVIKELVIKYESDLEELDA